MYLKFSIAVLLPTISFAIIVHAETPVIAEWGQLEAKSAAANLKVTGRVIAGEGALKIESAGFTGRVSNILVREGDRVTSGTPLLEVAGAECISLGEERRVAASHGLQDMVEAAAGRAEQLHVRIRGESRNQSCVLISAHAGTVIKRNVEIGSAFNIGDSLITLIDTTHLSAEFDVNERDLGVVRVGQKVTFQIAGDSSNPIESKITSVIPSIDAVTRVARIRVGAVRFSRPTLEAQLIGEINVPVAARQEKVANESFEVKPQAVVFARNRRFVVKGSNEKPVAAEVVVLSEDSNSAYISPKNKDELKKGDRIAITQAMYLLKRALPENVD